MNKLEFIKAEKNPLDIKHDLARFAREGWESISESDLQRLKWYGLFLRKPTPGFFMLRVRIPNGITNADQVNILAAIAARFGNGVVDLTTRQQVQIRHLKIDDILEVFSMLESVGLTSLQTGLDNVRNIMGCPVSGLHPRELLDAAPWIRELNSLILGNPEFINLPRKVNVAITGCPDNCVHAESQDIALVPARKNIDGQLVAGFNVLAGGKLGSGGYRIASPLDIFVRPEEVVDVCSAIILLYRDHGDRELRTQNRLAFLLDDWGEMRFREGLVRRLNRSLHTAGEDQRNRETNEHLGVYRQKAPGLNYVGLKVVVGRIRADLLQQVALLAHKYGTGEIRIAPNQSLILTNVCDSVLNDLLEEPALKELHYAPSPLMKHLVSCVGSDYCALATIETKSRAVELARQLESRLENVNNISMHWSGCPAGCGNHLLADIGLLGKRARVGGKTVDAVDIFVGGRSGRHPKEAVRIMENVPCDRLPQVLEQIIPFHTREKMHPVKRKRRRETSASSPAQKTTPESSWRGLSCPIPVN